MKSNRHRADQARSYTDIEVEARLIRERLGLKRNACLPSIELFEGLGRLAQPSLAVTYGVEELSLGVDAESRFHAEHNAIEVILAPYTYDQLEAEVPRARFCLAHEIGHVALHSVELIRLSRLPGPTTGLARGNAEEFPAYLDVEWQANAFASAFLMPATALAELAAGGDLCENAVVRSFNVSKKCAQIRLEKFAQRRNLFLRRM